MIDYFAEALEILRRGELVTGTEYMRVMGGMYAQANQEPAKTFGGSGGSYPVTVHVP